MHINIDVYVYSCFLTKTLRALHRGLAIIQICYGPSVIDKTILKKKTRYSGFMPHWLKPVSSLHMNKVA